MPQAQNTPAAEKGWAFLIPGPHTPVGWGLVFAVSTRPCASLSSPPAQVAVKDRPETSCSPGPNTPSWCPPVPPTPAGASLWVADSPPDTREAGAVSPRAQCPAPDQGLAHAQEDLRGMGGRPWASQESEDLSGRRLPPPGSQPRLPSPKKRVLFTLRLSSQTKGPETSWAIMWVS